MKKRSHRLALAIALVFVVWAAALRGNRWSLLYHPDELPVAKWIGDVDTRGYISDRLYPSGWFVCLRPLLWVRQRYSRLTESFDAYQTQENRAEDERPAPLSTLRPKPKHDLLTDISFGRACNAFLLSVAVLFVFCTLTELGAGPPSAAFAALLLGLSPIAQEHAHYCETDIAVMLSLAATLWAGARALRKASLPWFLVSALLAGFAVSCKYTLLPVLALPMAHAAWFLRGRAPRHALWLLPTLVILALAGFLLGTPVLTHDSSIFFRGLRGDVSSVHELRNARALLRELASMGTVFLSWCLLSAAGWRRPPRRHLLGAPLFLAVYLAFAILAMPWIRNQETLPLLVPLCISAALLFDTACRDIRSHEAWRRSLAIALLLFGTLVLVSGAVRGVRMASAFQHAELRALAANWLRRSAPESATVGLGHYAGRVGFEQPCEVMNVGRLDERWLSYRGTLPDYAFLNTSVRGRNRNRDPDTGLFKTNAVLSLEAFARENTLLQRWAIAPGPVRPVFAQHDLAFWRIRRPDDPPNGPVPLPFHPPRPIYYDTDSLAHHSLGLPSALGPAGALRLDGQRRRFHPFPASTGTLYAVSVPFVSRVPVRVAWDRLATPRETTSEPGHAAISTLPPTATLFENLWDAMPSVLVRAPRTDRSSHILVSATPSAVHAARLLRRFGEPQAALDLLRSAGISSPEERTEAFLAAALSGSEPDPVWRDAAAQAVADYDAWVAAGAPPAGASLCGTPMDVLQDFARVRLRDIRLFAKAELPLVLPPGNYTVRAAVRTADDDWFTDRHFLNKQRAPFRVIEKRGAYLIGETTLRLHRYTPLAIDADNPVERHSAVFLDALEIRWNPAEFLRGEVELVRELLKTRPVDSKQRTEQRPRRGAKEVVQHVRDAAAAADNR